MIEKTCRGFAISNFNDMDGKPCSLQKSSLAFEEAIWLGVEKPTPRLLVEGISTEVPFPKDTLFNDRMHLTQPMAKELVSDFNKFIETGKVEPKYKLKDRYDNTYSIYSEDNTLWLGIDDPKPQVCNLGWHPVPYPKETTFDILMHLDQNLVKVMLPYLNKFIKTGEL